MADRTVSQSCVGAAPRPVQPRRAGRPSGLSRSRDLATVVGAVTWVESDSLLRIRDEPSREVLAELGFQRAGSVISQVINEAIEAVRGSAPDARDALRTGETNSATAASRKRRAPQFSSATSVDQLRKQHAAQAEPARTASTTLNTKDLRSMEAARIRYRRENSNGRGSWRHTMW